MKLKITITGPKVQGVGYRQFVTELAMQLSLHGFEAFNEEDGSVEVLVAGDERRVKKFLSIVKEATPVLAHVDTVIPEEYTGEIMPLWQFASILTAEQLNKAIPLLLNANQNTDTLIKNSDVIIDEIKGLRGDLVGMVQVQQDIKRIQENVSAIMERLGMT